VFLFLRNVRAAADPGGRRAGVADRTFGVMYLCGYSLDNLSLMALTIATGFVVDDAIVVLENISRHIEDGMPRREAALQGAREVGFTVDLDVHIADRGVHPDLADGRHRRPAVPRVRGGAVGRRPGVAGGVADHDADDVRPAAAPARRSCPRPVLRWTERGFEAALGGYRRTLGWALDHSRLMILILLATIGLNIYLFISSPRASFRSRTPAG